MRFLKVTIRGTREINGIYLHYTEATALYYSKKDALLGQYASYCLLSTGNQGSAEWTPRPRGLRELQSKSGRPGFPDWTAVKPG